MDKSAYHLWDWHRILFGNAPVEFMLEIFFRVVITYIFLLFIVAWLGKRMSGQVTITELGIVIMLGAVVAPPMEAPECGVIQGVLILFLVLWMLRISRAQLFTILRTKKVNSLGKVERLYMEASGKSSLYETKESRPGLSVLPPGDDTKKAPHAILADTL